MTVFSAIFVGLSTLSLIGTARFITIQSTQSAYSVAGCYLTYGSGVVDKDPAEGMTNAFDVFWDCSGTYTAMKPYQWEVTDLVSGVNIKHINDPVNAMLSIKNNQYGGITTYGTTEFNAFAYSQTPLATLYIDNNNQIRNGQQNTYLFMGTNTYTFVRYDGVQVTGRPATFIDCRYTPNTRGILLTITPQEMARRLVTKTLGEQLVDLINEYRKSANLGEIPLSKSLTAVGDAHIQNVEYAQAQNVYGQDSSCNLHSWYSKPEESYSDCCYTSDHAQASCMWNKPREISGNKFTGNGFEISAGGYSSIVDALNGWKSSSGHNDVILNNGMWANYPWKSIGCGVSSANQSSKFYHCWFSNGS